MEYTVNIIIHLQRCTIYFNFKHSQACICVGQGLYSVVYYEVVSVFIYTFVFRKRTQTFWCKSIVFENMQPLNFKSLAATAQLEHNMAQVVGPEARKDN